MAAQATADLESQYELLQRGAGLVDLGNAVLDVRGADAVDFIQGQVTNDVEALEPHRGCYALLLNPKGRILADMRVLMLARDRLLLVVARDLADDVRSKLAMYTIGRDAEVDASDRKVVSLIGPASGERLGASPPPDEHAFSEAEIGSANVLAVRTHFGIDVICGNNDADNVESALSERAPRVGEQVAEVLRIEAGRPRYGHDMSADNLPAEVGLEDSAVSFTKGCYVGQEPVARMHHRGHPNWHLRGLELAETAMPGDAVAAGERDVGKVTSACVSPRLGAIALAIIRREVEPGSRLKVGLAATSAGVIELPFDPAREQAVGEP